MSCWGHLTSQLFSQVRHSRRLSLVQRGRQVSQHCLCGKGANSFRHRLYRDICRLESRNSRVAARYQLQGCLTLEGLRACRLPSQPGGWFNIEGPQRYPGTSSPYCDRRESTPIGLVLHFGHSHRARLVVNHQQNPNNTLYRPFLGLQPIKAWFQLPGTRLGPRRYNCIHPPWTISARRALLIEEVVWMVLRPRPSDASCPR